MTDAELHTLSRLLLEKTALVQVGSMGVRSAIELMLQKGYRILPPPQTESSK